MSSKTEVLSFDDWARFQGLPLEKDDNGLYVNRHTHYARKGWEAKPEKAEVDKLQKRIDELEWFVKSVINWDAHPKDLELNSGSWGVRDFYRNYAIRILKGEETK